MRIAVLGPLEVRTDDDVPVVVPGAKERLLLAALAAEAPAAVSAGRLAETLWDGDAPPTARRSLQTHVVRLRSALEPDRPKGSTGRFVVRRGPGYALAVERHELDALQMTDLAVRGRAHLMSGDPAAASSELRSALALWRGEAYADWPDAGFAQAERRRLTEVRAAALASSVEADLDQGRHAEVVPELERLVTEEPLREDWWRLLMLALYRAGRQGDALAVGRRVRAVLAEELGADPGPGLRDMEAAILSQDPGLDPPRRQRGDGTEGPEGSDVRAPAPSTAVCPYKGLAAYQPADATLFHGRERVVSRLVGRVVDAPLVLVSGPSGAGKSSVVRAGLVPALHQGAVPGSEAWLPVIVTPGARPVDALAGLTGESPPDAPVLLVCDQFEELWAPGVEPGERRAFLDAVTGLIDDGIVVRCVAVLRGDHVGRLAEHAPFTDRLGAALVLVPPPTDAELREIVMAPAAAVGLTVEPGLVDAVVGDVLGRAGALPLLSTALVGTWERRSGGELTLAGYLQAGGVAGALARSADVAYDSLDPPAREAARALLVRLADVDDGGALVRRRVSLAELDLDGEGGLRRREVVEVFVHRRLLALDGERLEVAHEALLIAWPRLARWLEDDAAGRAIRRHLAPAAREWDDLGRPVEELYGGARLAVALDLLAETGQGGLTPLEARFLEASAAHADAVLRAALDRAERETTARQRTRRLAQGLAVVLVAGPDRRRAGRVLPADRRRSGGRGRARDAHRRREPVGGAVRRLRDAGARGAARGAGLPPRRHARDAQPSSGHADGAPTGDPRGDVPCHRGPRPARGRRTVLVPGDGAQALRLGCAARHRARVDPAGSPRSALLAGGRRCIADRLRPGSGRPRLRRAVAVGDRTGRHGAGPCERRCAGRCARGALLHPGRASPRRGGRGGHDGQAHAVASPEGGSSRRVDVGDRRRRNVSGLLESARRCLLTGHGDGRPLPPRRRHAGGPGGPGRRTPGAPGLRRTATRKPSGTGHSTPASHNCGTTGR